MAKTPLKRARVLSPISVDGTDLQPNSVIEGTEAQIKSFENAVDANPQAVEYCMKELKVKPINIAPKQEIAEEVPGKNDE